MSFKWLYFSKDLDCLWDIVTFTVQLLKKQYSERKRQLGSNNTAYAILGDSMSGSWFGTNIVTSKILTQNNIRVRVFSDARRITATRCLFPWDTLTAFDSNVVFARFRTGPPPPLSAVYLYKHCIFVVCGYKLRSGESHVL